MSLEDLTTADIIRAGSVSQKEAVRKAYDKLKFAILMAHTEEDIQDLCDHAVYQARISQKTHDGEYDTFVIRWADDQFVVYSPSEGAPISGTATTLDKDPAIVYFNNPPVVEQIAPRKLERAMRQELNKRAKRK